MAKTSSRKIALIANSRKRTNLSKLVIRTNREFFHLAMSIERCEVKIKYAWRIFDMLDGLRPGDTFNIDNLVKARTRLYFANIVCCYLFLKTNRKIYFSDDWSCIYKDR